MNTYAANDDIAEGIVAPAMMRELDDGEPSLLSSSSSVWISTAIGPADFKNALEAIQKRRQEAEEVERARLPSQTAKQSPAAPEEPRKRSMQNVLVLTFTGAELVEQFTAIPTKKLSRPEAVTVAQTLLNNGVIECVDAFKRRDTISPKTSGAAQNYAQFDESLTYTPVLLHELSDKLITNLLGLLRQSGRGTTSPRRGAFAFREADAQECWTKNASVVVPTRQDASEICQEMVNKGFIEPAGGGSVLSKVVHRGEAGAVYVVRSEQHMYWSPLVCPGWKVRWFLCRSASEKKLYCFKNPRQARPKAFLDLGEAYFNMLGRLDFAIETPAKVWKFQALSQEAVERWKHVVEKSSAYVYATNYAIDVLSSRILKSTAVQTKGFLKENATALAIKNTSLADLRRKPRVPSEFAVYAPLSSIDYSRSAKILAEKELPCALQMLASDHVTALTLAGGRLWAGTMKGSIYATPLSRQRGVVASTSRLPCLGEKRNSASRGPHKDRVVAFAVTRKAVWSGDAAGGVVVWDAETCALVTLFEHRNGLPIVAAADRHRELVYLSGTRPGTVEVFPAAGGGMVPDKTGARAVVALPGCTGDVAKIRVSEDCRTWWAAGAQQDRVVYEVDAETQGVLRCVRVPSGISPVVSFVPCKSRVCVGNTDNGGERQVMWTSHAGGELCFWDFESGRIYARRSACKGHGWAAENLWVKKGRAVTLGKDGDIVEWDASAASVVRGVMPATKVHTNRGCIQTLGCDAESGYVAVVNEVNEIIVYDISNRLSDKK